MYFTLFYSIPMNEVTLFNSFYYALLSFIKCTFELFRGNKIPFGGYKFLLSLFTFSTFCPVPQKRLQPQQINSIND